MRNFIFRAGEKIHYTCAIPFLAIFVLVAVIVISQFYMATVDQFYPKSLVQTAQSNTTSGMSSNMSGMQGMSGMSSNMSGMQGMSRMLGISSNEQVPIFLELMGIITACLVGIPFAWVFVRERRKRYKMDKK